MKISDVLKIGFCLSKLLVYVTGVPQTFLSCTSTENLSSLQKSIVDILKNHVFENMGFRKL